MTVRVRIAPSPTGNLHIGTARTAVFNWLFARHLGGQFILRIEDTDQDRSRPEYTENILSGLKWLGLNWDEGPFFQSQRLDLYHQATQALLDQGLAYRCYCTETELEAMRAQQVARKEAPRYDNRHRNLTTQQQAAFEAEGRQPVIRFKIDDDRLITWHDMVRGDITWKGSDLGGDMVISRAAIGGEIGMPLYNMAVVVDDIDMKITHVIRGEDHIANTAKQILLYEAFGAPIPQFGHTPLILGASGQKLSKRDGVTSIFDFQNMGFTAEGMTNYMMLLGWAPPTTEEIFTLEEAAKVFSFERVNKAGAKFDWDKLDWINSQYLHKMSADNLTNNLIPYWQAAGYQFDPIADRVWLESISSLIGSNLTRLNDAVKLSEVFFKETVTYDEEAVQQLQEVGGKTSLTAILTILETQALTKDNAEDLIRQVMKRKKLKKGLVMRSLRAALTGSVHGPDLLQSWVLLHQRGLAQSRLENAVKAIDNGFPEETRKLVTPETLEVKTPIHPPSLVQEVKQPEPVVLPTIKEVETTPEPVVLTTAKEVEITPEPVVLTTAKEVEITPEPVVLPTAQEVETTPEPVVLTTPQEVEPTPEPVVLTTAKEVEITPEPVVLTTPQEVEPTPEPVAKVTEKVTDEQTTSSHQTLEVLPLNEEKEDEQAIEVTVVDANDSTFFKTSKIPDLELPESVNEAIKIVANLPNYLIAFYQDYQRPILTIGLILGAFITLKVMINLLEVLDDIPLLSPALKLFGLWFLGSFAYRYLLWSSKREELANQFAAWKKQVLGKED